MSAKLIQVIEVVTNRGTGVVKDPVRSVTQYWTVEGDLLAERDPHPQVSEDPRIFRAIQMLVAIRPSPAAIDGVLAILREPAP